MLWGRRIDDLEYALDVIAACGYEGVEFAQHHDQIFVRKEEGRGVRKLRGVGELLAHLEKRGLKLIGLVAGTLTDRTRFLGDYKDAYLYLDRWPEKEAKSALEAGYTLAIHPHWLMPIRRLRQALAKIAEYRDTPFAKQVRLLLDTAHSLIAEDDPVKAARHHRHQLAAVHLKSWRPDYGRWSHRYAHGFCPPGEGIVPVQEVMDELHAAKFDGWVIMEQDHYDARREQTALRCAQWFEKHGGNWDIHIQIDALEVQRLQDQCQINPYFEALGRSGIETFVIGSINGNRPPQNLFNTPLTPAALSGPLSELLLGRELSRRVSHRPDPSEFYSIISTKVRELLGSSCVKVWSYNPLIGESGEFCLLGMSAPGFTTTGCKTIIAETESLAGSILTHPQICQFDLRDDSYAGLFADKSWLAQLRQSAPWLTILPVFNTSNTHQLRYLITSASPEPLLVPIGTGDFEPEASLDRLGQLDALSWIVAHWADYLTDEICSAASGFMNHLCGNMKQSVTDFIDSLSVYLHQTFECNAVTVFLEDITSKRLEPIGNSDAKLDWSGHPHYYSLADQTTHTYIAWRQREMVFSSSATQGIAREKRPNDDPRDEILFAPLVRRNGKCHGVVRLHNKRRPSNDVSSMFTDDDAAKLDAIIQTAIPHLELLKMQEQQMQSLARMVHEFQAPLVAIRGAVDLMQSDIERKGLQSSNFFKRDFLDDVLQWTELMGRLTRNARVFAGGPRSETLRPRKTFLLSEVVMPVLRQIRPLVPDGVKFDCHQEELRSIPALWIDRNQMQQVFFNLLSNSIKYGGTTDLIRVLITGGPVGNSYTIFFQDWGAGIDEEDKEEVFQPGYRGAKAVLSDVTGLGIGCYVIRSIVEAHGGTIHVRSCRNPTTFEISLPQRLRLTAPEVH